MKYIVPGILLLIAGVALAGVGLNMAETAAGHQTALGELFGTSAYRRAVTQEAFGYSAVVMGCVLALFGLIVAIVGPLASGKK